MLTAPLCRMVPQYAPKSIGVGPEGARSEVRFACHALKRLSIQDSFNISILPWLADGGREAKNAPPTKLKAVVHEETYCLRDEEAERGQFGGCRLFGRFRIGSSLTFRNITLLVLCKHGKNRVAL